MSKPREFDLYAPLINGARRDRWFLFRIADGSFGRKPFDLAGSASNGLAVGLEVKVVNKLPEQWQPFPWNLFSTHQIEWLKLYADQNSYALMALYDYIIANMRIYKLTSSAKIDAAVANIPCLDLIKDRNGSFIGWSDLFGTI